MAHPYAKHAADKAGRAKARGYKLGGSVDDPYLSAQEQKDLKPDSMHTTNIGRSEGYYNSKMMKHNVERKRLRGHGDY